MDIQTGAIVEYQGRLCEVIGYIQRGEKTLLLEVLRDNDKDKCSHCGTPQKTQLHIVEGCLNWRNGAKPVKTLPQSPNNT